MKLNQLMNKFFLNVFDFIQYKMHVRAVGKIHPQVKPGCAVRKN